MPLNQDEIKRPFCLSFGRLAAFAGFRSLSQGVFLGWQGKNEQYQPSADFEPFTNRQVQDSCGIRTVTARKGRPERQTNEITLPPAGRRTCPVFQLLSGATFGFLLGKGWVDFTRILLSLGNCHGAQSELAGSS